MAADAVFCELNDKYGGDFNWSMVSHANKSFVAELKREIGSAHFLYHKQMRAVAKCDSNDDVLYFADNEIYYIFHLTYSSHNTDEFPKYKEFTSINEVKIFLDKTFIENYL